MILNDLKLIQHSRAKQVVQRAIKHGRMAHAYLLHGPEGSGKEAIALALAQTFLCERRGKIDSSDLFAAPVAGEWACGQCSSCKRVAEMAHPDVHAVIPRAASANEAEITEVLRSLATQPLYRMRPWENSFILIDDVRELKRTFATSSYEGRGSVALLFEAQRLKAESANALLKLLEEPPDEKFFILTCNSLESLLPTIISRCQPILVAFPRHEEIAEILQTQHGVEPGRARFVASLANGNLRYAFALLEEDLEARRKLAVEYLRMAFKFNKPVEQVEFLNQLVQEHDRHALQQLLQFCASWLRDAYVLKCGGEQQQIINTDFRAALLELNKNLPQFDFNRVLEEVEYAITCLERYVQPWLVLMALLQRIRQSARPEK